MVKQNKQLEKEKEELQKVTKNVSAENQNLQNELIKSQQEQLDQKKYSQINDAHAMIRIPNTNFTISGTIPLIYLIPKSPELLEELIEKMEKLDYQVHTKQVEDVRRIDLIQVAKFSPCTQVQSDKISGDKNKLFMGPKKFKEVFQINTISHINTITFDPNNVTKYFELDIQSLKNELLNE